MKPCTCDNCLGSSVSCRVDGGERLGDLWYCQKRGKPPRRIETREWTPHDFETAAVAIEADWPTTAQILRDADQRIAQLKGSLLALSEEWVNGRNVLDGCTKTVAEQVRTDLGER